MLCIELEVPVTVIHIIFYCDSQLFCLLNLITAQVDTVYLSCLEGVHTCIGIIQHDELYIFYRTSVRIIEIFVCSQSHMIVVYPLGHRICAVRYERINIISIIISADLFICFLVYRIIRSKCQQMLRIRNRVFKSNFQRIIVQCLYTQF